MEKNGKNVVSSSLTTIEDAKTAWVVCFTSTVKNNKEGSSETAISDETIEKIKDNIFETFNTLGISFNPKYAVLHVSANDRLKETDKAFAEINVKIIKEAK